ncbi:lantibiotic dehydratase [Nocardia sp. NPDC052254]|uniref:lantibiotic dehydratase n=1 Tax=Nocardia sp. NPDC052254 TaxID=3155681 RepID=UPI00343A8A6C
MLTSIPPSSGKELLRNAPRYTARPFFLLRSASRPIDAATKVLSQFPAGCEQPQLLLETVQRIWSDELVHAAVAVSSSDLAAAMDNLLELSDKDRIRAARGLLRYVNRMSSRATPFGLMAGVAAGSFTSESSSTVSLHTDARDGVFLSTRARADMGLFLHMLHGAVSADTTTNDLLVRTNDLAHVGRGRAWLPHADAYGIHSNKSVSLRHTAAVDRVMTDARLPVTLVRLRETLLDLYPQVPAGSVDHLLRELIDLNLLVSAHRPRLVQDQGYRPLDDLPMKLLTQDQRRCLTAFSARIDTSNNTSGLSDVLPLLLSDETQTVAELAGEQSLLQFDSLLNVGPGPVLPAEVAALAEEAADVLAIVGSDARYPQRLLDWATAFTDRYGAGAEVPVLEALSEETGLGPPNGYSNPQRSYVLEPETNLDRPVERESLLLRLISHALANRSSEVELDDQWLIEFAKSGSLSGDNRPVTPALDICMELWAGDGKDQPWTGVVTEMGIMRGGRTFSRFYDLLDKEIRHQLRTMATDEERRCGDAVVAELTYLPLRGRAANISIRPPMRQHELAVNISASPDTRHLSLDDIHVGVRSGRLYLHSRSLDRDILFTQYTNLNLLSSPNVCQFLIEASDATFRNTSAFHWGPIGAGATFLPRLRRGNVVVRRASWHLRPEELDPDLPDAEFSSALDAWAGTWMVPTMVRLVEGDNHLLLDLTSSLSLFELRRALTAARAAHVRRYVQLVEIGPDPTGGFLRDQHDAAYVAEVVVPVVTSDIRPTPQSTRTSNRRRAIPTEERLRPPGGEWLYLKLYTESDANDRILTENLPTLTQRLCGEYGAGRPFFLRYSDPAPHLRIRFPLSRSAARGTALAEAAQWGHQLVEQGAATDFAFATYHREIERYGGPDLVPEAEILFGFDSSAVTAIIGYLLDAGDGALTREAVAALTLDRMARSLLPELDDRRRLLRTNTPTRSGSPEYRAVADDLWAHHNLGGPTAALLRTVSRLWDEPGTRFRTLMGAAQAQGRLWGPSDDVIRSLVHMHCNRLGIHGDRERAAYGMWRRLLDRESAIGKSRDSA